jgi:Ca2+-transporting ATPase
MSANLPGRANRVLGESRANERLGSVSAPPAGLSSDDARRRLEDHGPNRLPEQPPKPIWQRFLTQFASPLIYILLVALVVDAAIWVYEGADSFPVETLAIALILLLNAGLGMYQEGKAEAALDRLKAMAAALVWVLRDGKLVHLPATELVPGDVIRSEAGDRIAADGVFHDAQGILVDESILTGESVPVEKVAGDDGFSGTLIVRGKGYLEVRHTGRDSAMGRLAVMIGGIEAGRTPLEQRLEVFGRQIARAVLGLAVAMVAAGWFVEGLERIGHVLLFAVALAVAAVPEGLPAVLTLTLSLGVERMAKRNAVVRKLSAVEALGSVTVIATDKTGTLTENRMFVRALDSRDPQRALRAMVLANDAESTTGAGDPLELALLDYAGHQGLDPVRLRHGHPRLGVMPFDSGHKYMRVTVQEDTELVSYLKGAPEVLVERSELSPTDRRGWLEKANKYASQGCRVLAVAWCRGEREVHLSFLGLILLWDPPRAEVPGAIRRAQEAGIRVMMITGDHPATALAVAADIGIPPSRVLTGADVEALSQSELSRAVTDTNVFARVAPEHKLRLVEALQAGGDVVAMTGDGVNDAPALKRANVGIAMGQRGSDVSREVAHLVLLDDNFATIVTAIEEGRSIYENIQKFVRFLFSTNLALVLLVVGGAVGSYVFDLQDPQGGLLLPLTAVQLLWINIIADGPAALALAFDRNPGVMQQRPRQPSAPLLDAPSLAFIVVTGIVKAVVGGILLVLLPLYGFTMAVTRSSVFLYEAIAQLLFAYPSRRVSVLPLGNRWLHLAVALGVGLQLLTLVVPGLKALLGLESLDVASLTSVTIAVFASWIVAQLFSVSSSRRAQRAKCVAGHASTVKSVHDELDTAG